MLSTREIRTLRTLLGREDERLPIIFNALGEPRRCKIFRSVLKSERLCVSDIAHLLKISLPLASQHLRILEITKLLIREKEGRSVYFRANLDDELVRTISRSLR